MSNNKKLEKLFQRINENKKQEINLYDPKEVQVDIENQNKKDSPKIAPLKLTLKSNKKGKV